MIRHKALADPCLSGRQASFAENIYRATSRRSKRTRIFATKHWRIRPDESAVLFGGHPKGKPGSSAKADKQHILFMSEAIRLAKKGLGLSSPNPPVGAVVVQKGRIVGRGFHHEAGREHAEVLALRSAGKRAKGSALYVSLEPCAHFGKTPPCVDALLKSGIQSVYIGAKDPNPLTNGKGVRRLRREGLKVITGILEPEARELIRAFEKRITTGIPYVTLKLAQSLDGKIATSKGESQWISGLESRKRVHRLRASVDAVLIGIRTLLKDNPLLTSRQGKSVHQPIKVILDSQLRTPLSARIFSGASPAPVILAASSTVKKSRIVRMSKRAEVILTFGKGKRVNIKELLRLLADQGINHLMVEGGGEVAFEFLKHRLVDEVYFFVAPLIIGGSKAPGSVGGKGFSILKASAPQVAFSTIEKVGDDLLIYGKFKKVK